MWIQKEPQNSALCDESRSQSESTTRRVDLFSESDRRVTCYKRRMQCTRSVALIDVAEGELTQQRRTLTLSHPVTAQVCCTTAEIHSSQCQGSQRKKKRKFEVEYFKKYSKKPSPIISTIIILTLTSHPFSSEFRPEKHLFSEWSRARADPGLLKLARV